MARRMIVPTVPVLIELLGELGLQHRIDEDGDLLVGFERFVVYFVLLGDRRDELLARAYLNHRLPLVDRPSILDRIDQWHRTHVAPRAFTVETHPGTLGVYADATQTFRAGATREQIKTTLVSWLAHLNRFVEWFDTEVREPG